MNNLNSILIEGNLTKDPLLKKMQTGVTVCHFSVASNRFYKQNDEKQKEVSFFDVETWSKLADHCKEYLRKGRGVRIVGRLKQDRWRDSDGAPRTQVKIVAEHVEFRPSYSGNQQRRGSNDLMEIADASSEQGTVAAETPL